MHGSPKNRKRVRRGGAAFFLALFLLTVPAAATPAADSGSARMLIPVGHTVGIKLFARGVMVVKLPEDDTPARECGLKTGDVIVKCGGVSVTSTEQFQSLLQKTGEDATDLQVRRGGESVTLSVSPEQNEKGAYCIGAWIRDSMAGIGTITYVDPATSTFGALGHGIADTDTAQLMPFASGSILPSTVKAVKKGETGSAGELRGDFDLETDLGQLYANTSCGIFGTLTEDCGAVAGKAVPAGTARTGPAVIRSNVRGDKVEEFDIQITRVIEDAADGRQLVLSVTDPDLIEATGGIVQGMGVIDNMDNTKKPANTGFSIVTLK